MKKFLKLGVPAAAFVVAAAIGTMTANSASAGEYCRTDVSGHMTGCGFSTMEQCQAAASGIGGDCFRDPNLAGSSSAFNNGNGGNAFAYQPNEPRTTRHMHRRGSEANPQ